MGLFRKKEPILRKEVIKIREKEVTLNKDNWGKAKPILLKITGVSNGVLERFIEDREEKFGPKDEKRLKLKMLHGHIQALQSAIVADNAENIAKELHSLRTMIAEKAKRSKLIKVLKTIGIASAILPDEVAYGTAARGVGVGFGDIFTTRSIIQIIVISLIIFCIIGIPSIIKLFKRLGKAKDTEEVVQVVRKIKFA